MPEQRIAVEAHLGVEHEEIAVLGLDQRVDLEHFAIEIHEGGIELLGQLLRLLVEIARQLEREGHCAAVMRHEALRRVDGDGGDLLGRRMRDFLDIHSAFGRYDHGHAASGAIDQHRQIVFFGNVDAVGDIEAVDLLARITGLHGHQRIAEHVPGIGFDILDAGRQADTALGIGAEFLELALAATTGMDLRLHDIKRSGQLLGTGDRFLDGQRGMAGGDADPVFSEQFLGLVFVNVHGVRRPSRDARGVMGVAAAISMSGRA